MRAMVTVLAAAAPLPPPLPPPLLHPLPSSPLAHVAGKPVVYLHFHKAAGTTACEAFKKGVLRTFIDGERDHNCNCNPQEFLDALRAGDGPKVASFMREAGVDVCFVERLQYWPAPSSLMQLQRSVRLATTLREPWQRLVSNYERDSSSCLHRAQDQVPNASLKSFSCRYCAPEELLREHAYEILPLREYAEMRGCYPNIGYGLQLPDLYVRALNGASKATTADVAAMDDASLERAKEVLAAFDEVLVLERPDFSARLAALTRTPQGPVPHKSNNKYSDARTATSTADVAQHLPANIAAARADHAHESDWLNKISRLDAELYSWAFGRAAPPLPSPPPPPKPNKRVPHAAATFVQGTGAAASSGWQPTGTTGTAKLQSSWSHKHPLTKEPKFACDIKNSNYTAMLKTLDAAHPDLFDVLQLPEHSSFLFSGTSFMREIHDNFRAANAHRQQRIEQCLVDTSAAATNGSLLFHCEEGFTPSPHVRAIYRVFYSGNTSSMMVDNHFLQMTEFEPLLRRFLAHFHFDAAFFMPPHADAWFRRSSSAWGSPAPPVVAVDMDAILNGTASRPEWWVDLEAAGSTAQLVSDSNRSAQLVELYKSTTPSVAMVIPWGADSGDQALKKRQGVLSRYTALGASVIDGGQLKYGRMCSPPDCAHNRGHQCNPGVPSWTAYEIGRRMRYWP